ncbi:MAG: patatin-like phospholipase family protein, partial [Rhizobiaceae bacterium]|nr:patatin-like phospholipase family protein [Rhizobiaceae bacterium]
MSKALVLSGGGPIAVAWECGLIAGLAQSGCTLADADFILGTSAGAIVGAQLAGGRDPVVMAEKIMAEADRPRGAGNGALHSAEAITKLPELFAKSQSSELGRIEVGAYALASSTPDDIATYVQQMSSIIDVDYWPETLGIVAVDIADGKPRILRQDCGATLGTAVAASCCLPGLSPPVPIAGRLYMDGGMRSTANADLIAHFDTVFILGFHPPGPVGQRIMSRVTAQADTLTTGGMRVLVVAPDEACLEAIGANSRDFSRRPQIARTAIMQGGAIADRLAEH